MLDFVDDDISPLCRIQTKPEVWTRDYSSVSALYIESCDVSTRAPSLSHSNLSTVINCYTIVPEYSYIITVLQYFECAVSDKSNQNRPNHVMTNNVLTKVFHSYCCRMKNINRQKDKTMDQIRFCPAVTPIHPWTFFSVNILCILRNQMPFSGRERDYNEPGANKPI